MKKLLLLFFMLNISCLADGFYKTANATLPSITGQRAIIKHKDGVQTMVIESALDSEAQELGWIVPLPSVPTEVKKVEPTVFRQFNREVSPDVDVLNPFGIFVIPLLSTLFLLFLAYKTKENTFFYRVMFLLLTFAVFTITAAIVVPALSANRGFSTTTSGVTIIVATEAGNYDIRVLQATNGEALSKWCQQAGLAKMNKSELKIINDYIAKKWCFVCTRLKRKESGSSTPHPLSFTFPSSKIIYPMALTALAETTAYLDFFVISDQTVTHPQLKTFISRRYFYKELASHEKFKAYYPNKREEIAGLSFDRRHVGLRSFNAEGLFWDGMVVSRLGAKIAPDDMKDMVFENRPYQLIERKPVAKDVAQGKALSGALGYSLVFVMLLMFIFLFTAESKEKSLLKLSLVILLISAVIIFIIRYQKIDIIDIDSSTIKTVRVRDKVVNWQEVKEEFKRYAETVKPGERLFSDFIKRLKENGFTSDPYNFVTACEIDGEIWLEFIAHGSEAGLLQYASYLKLSSENFYIEDIY